MKECISFIRSDLFRYRGSSSITVFFRAYFTNPGFKYSFWMRLTGWLSHHKLYSPIYLLSKLILLHYSYKFGIEIPSRTRIGRGFYIGHFSCIIVSLDAVIGNNVNISQGVTIGASNRGKHKGVPIIGDEVYIGPGAKIIGNITIGNRVCIGANAVVTEDVPDNSVVGGIPAKILSMGGSEGYINRKAE